MRTYLRLRCEMLFSLLKFGDARVELLHLKSHPDLFAVLEGILLHSPRADNRSMQISLVSEARHT